mmetsp:Transcript_8331/g.10925  ORF Transcript_8331/g.10925 Transcript_8331/m.10925 type:complete len:344 (-) Transcript_8331:297-1328(-)|eukprot:CAMPEP_0198147072 /NCGR_PEP_ID=MMETSP1443-20131203/33187_1 /TAXON_ID=186043 /ORGANISM="Entomoneis sp., Strain CCMP2396" /LENGTH=343 /DNA_ID=CAMNT_0043811227 /DNA_START=82 /DNA_END=1113 /DNA_ORIENTATION=-
MLLRISFILLIGELAVRETVAFRRTYKSPALPAFIKIRGGSDSLPTSSHDENENSTLDDPKSKENIDQGEEELLVDDITIDEDSSANVDRMEYADAYDYEEEESTPFNYSPTVAVEPDTSASTAPAVDSESAAKTKKETAQEEEAFVDTLPTIQLASDISEKMKTIMLKELKYRTSDLKVIRPEIASIIVAKKVQRPTEGLPAHWYKKESSKPISKFRRAAKKIILSVLACAIAIAAGSKVDVDFSFVDGLLPSAPAKTTASLPPPAPAQDLYQEALSIPEEVDSINEGKEEEDQPQQDVFIPREHDHSVRPGESYPTEPIDETWLDKGITAVERGLKSVFGQ